MSSAPIRVSYFSDILCIWAYIAERRLEELRDCFDDQVQIECHYISLFGDTKTKFEEGWKSRGGWQGYADHVKSVASEFDHISLGNKPWTETRPSSSASVHLILKAVQLTGMDKGTHDDKGATSDRCALGFREAFFRDGRDIANFDVQKDILSELGFDLDPILNTLKNGSAFAALCRDNELQSLHKIEGSPTFVLNDGRQKLYGNVGFKIIEANIQELLRSPNAERASWC